MAFFQCEFFSNALGRCTSVNVLLPQPAARQIGMASAGGKTEYPVLYLLHGLSDNQTIWMRRTSIERYVAALNLAVVMPDGQRSFYNDLPCGHRYWTYLSEELPQLIKSYFPISSRREDTFAAGLSMGGYGALKLALRRPDRYAFAGSLSGVTDLAALMRRQELFSAAEWAAVFGDWQHLAGTDLDLLHLVGEVAAAPGPRPVIRQWVGTGDGLYEDNQAFRRRMEEFPGVFDYRYCEAPGAHTWEFWDEHIQDLLRELPLQR